MHASRTPRIQLCLLFVPLLRGVLTAIVLFDHAFVCSCVSLSGNNCIFFEARKRKDLYMWVSKAPNGPSAKFQVQNIHTMAEVKLTGQFPLQPTRSMHNGTALTGRRQQPLRSRRFVLASLHCSLCSRWSICL